MPLLTRDQILSSDVAPTLELVSVPEWGGEVYVGIMTGAQRDRWEMAVGNTDKTKARDNIRALIVAYTARDESNRMIFSEADVPKLKEMSSVALDRVSKVAIRINHIGTEDVEVEEKNSEPTP
jgi:hypothetical protein